MKLSAEDARELVYGGDFTAEGLTVESDQLIDTSRWSEIHELVIRDRDGNLWMTGYTTGLTEMQDERPFEDQDEVTFVPAEKIEVTAYEYRKVTR